MCVNDRHILSIDILSKLYKHGVFKGRQYYPVQKLEASIVGGGTYDRDKFLQGWSWKVFKFWIEMSLFFL